MKQGSILLLARCNSNNSAPSIRYRCSILNVVAKRNITTGLFGLGLDEENHIGIYYNPLEKRMLVLYYMV